MAEDIVKVVEDFVENSNDEITYTIALFIANSHPDFQFNVFDQIQRLIEEQNIDVDVAIKIVFNDVLQYRNTIQDSFLIPREQLFPNTF